MSEVGKVLGTEDAECLEFWVGVADDQYLQLDDVVAVSTQLPDGKEVALYGIVDQVRSRYEGAKFDSDVFRVTDGVLPVGIATAARVAVTRVEPEIFVPPRPGLAVARAVGHQRDLALYFDRMERRFPAGLSRDGNIIFGNLEFLDGRRGAHVNISGISGVATKTTYALFLLHSLFHSGALGTQAASTYALVFNVKGEDLLYLDKRNRDLSDEDVERYRALGLPPDPFDSLALWAPVRRGVHEPMPDTGGRNDGVTPYYWTLREFCRERLLRFLFAEADSDSQLNFVISLIEDGLAKLPMGGDTPWIDANGARIDTFKDLVDFIKSDLLPLAEASRVAPATADAFVRRLEAGALRVGHLIRAARDSDAAGHRIDWRSRQVSVIDIHNLHDQAKRFVVGVVIKRLMEEKEDLGRREPLVFLVLDELNKYAPKDGWSPIKEVLLDIAERGRSLGVILIGAQQTASEIERRIAANAAFRVVGRLDAAEAQRDEYGFLTTATRVRSAILKPGSMFLHQPEIPIPLLVQFPFPAWATRPDEVAQEAPGEIPVGFLR